MKQYELICIYIYITIIITIIIIILLLCYNYLLIFRWALAKLWKTRLTAWLKLLKRPANQATYLNLRKCLTLQFILKRPPANKAQPPARRRQRKVSATVEKLRFPRRRLPHRHHYHCHRRTHHVLSRLHFLRRPPLRPERCSARSPWPPRSALLRAKVPTWRTWNLLGTIVPLHWIPSFQYSMQMIALSSPFHPRIPDHLLPKDHRGHFPQPWL